MVYAGLSRGSTYRIRTLGNSHDGVFTKTFVPAINESINRQTAKVRPSTNLGGYPCRLRWSMQHSSSELIYQWKQSKTHRWSDI